ncbi:conserved hypothetical protein [Ricinus communis]|uniref:Uncharacterized protein n=1 Tax=Ricinus communis TaxID=3988 RepID=B9SMC9_RICCO|nr:conserved hypothetical protein [Ricinus communis]|eukprot:XP_002527148.1 uncharacterized protein LOC8281455 [Ricinus communis]
MVQQAVDLKCSEYGLSNTESNVSACDKQFPVAVKKTALRDVQNENRISNSVANSSFSKDRGQANDAVKVAGTKRPSPSPMDPVSSPPPHHQSPSSNAANAQLVYVRRKSEGETGKSSICDGRSINVDCVNSRQLDQAEIMQPKPQIKEAKVSFFPAYAPMPVASLTNASGNSSVPLPIGNSSTRFLSTEPNYHPVASAISLLNNLKGMKNLHWEERYHQLQILLKKLDESDQEDYVQMLRSLSSVDLSRHAVELEKRTIQLSLEEAKEVQRVGVLNVLGKAMKNMKSPMTSKGELEK